MALNCHHIKTSVILYNFEDTSLDTRVFCRCFWVLFGYDKVPESYGIFPS